MIRVCMLVNKQYFLDPRVRRYAEGLAAAGAEVDVLCVRGRDAPAADAHSRIQVRTIPLGRANGNVSQYLLQYGVALPLFAVWLAILHVRRRYQIIHVHNMPDMLVLATLVPRLLGAKVILDIHDPMPEFYRIKFSKPVGDSLMLRLLRWQEKFSASLANAVIAVNADTRNALLRTGIAAGKITVVRNLPDCKVFDRHRYAAERSRNGDSFTLIYPGTIAPPYGLEVAVRALPLLLPHIPGIHLVLIGTGGEHIAALTQMADELGVKHALEVWPAIPTSEVPRHLALADVGIYPATPNPYMNMAVPTKVLEYAVMGLPIVASRLQVLEELFTDAAISFFEPWNEEQFARSVLELYRDPRRRLEMVRNADHIFVRNHSWSQEWELYRSLVNRLLAAKSRVGPGRKGAHGAWKRKRR